MRDICPGIPAALKPLGPLSARTVCETFGADVSCGRLLPYGRQAIRVAAENIPGVKKVEDHLVWIEPNTGVIVEGPGE